MSGEKHLNAFNFIFNLLIVPRRDFCGGSYCFMYWCCLHLMCVSYFSYVWVTEWPPLGKLAAHSAYCMFSWYEYLIALLVFSHLGFWSGNLFLIAHFPDLCLLVPFNYFDLFNVLFARIRY